METRVGKARGVQACKPDKGAQQGEFKASTHCAAELEVQEAAPIDRSGCSCMLSLTVGATPVRRETSRGWSAQARVLRGAVGDGNK